MNVNVSDPRAIANKILFFIEAAVAICLLILLAGAVSRAMHIPAIAQFLPALGFTELAYAGVGLWGISGKARV